VEVFLPQKEQRKTKGTKKIMLGGVTTKETKKNVVERWNHKKQSKVDVLGF
jgi:hypothetical protein